MKATLVNYSDCDGGAARAAYRIHRALLASGVESEMNVSIFASGDWTVSGPSTNFSRILAMLRPSIAGLLNRLLISKNPVLRSVAMLPSVWTKRLNNSDADVINLHWINGELMSIRDVGKLNKPVVWTLHDMWPFSGAEHYSEDLRWQEGYSSLSRSISEQGLDLDRWTWLRKNKSWKRPLHIIAPSNWMADCVKKSRLMKDWPVTVIPNCIDTDIWQPVEKALARKLLNLPLDVPLIVFGAMGGSSDPRKGFDLLSDALMHLYTERKDIELVIFGELPPRQPQNFGFKAHYLGYVSDDLTLRAIYSAADATVIPSRQDNLPNIGVESLACGTPVVAFDTCGLPDIVNHQCNGYLATAFDTIDLAKGIEWIISNKERHKELSIAARETAITYFSYPIVAKQYSAVFESACQTY